jgi:hypothetical protein
MRRRAKGVNQKDVGVGTLRVRCVPVPSYGECSSCHIEDDLNDGMCKFCLWMTNDDEADKTHDNKRGKEPTRYYGQKPVYRP